MAANEERIEIPIGEVNGSNVTFVTNFAYQAGTLHVWRGGQLIRSTDDDGFIEVDETTFETRIPWLLGDTITVMYLEL